MIAPDHRKKRYSPVTRRFLGPAIERFLDREMPKLFGPLMRKKVAGEILRLVEAFNPPKDHLKVGQVLWSAVHKSTRADHPDHILVPVVLTLVAQEDIDRLIKGVPVKKVVTGSMIRMMNEAYAQDALLSMRDLALLVKRSDATCSTFRIEHEKATGEIAPHTGNLQDMGSCVTHKYQIVRKVVLEGKDPTLVAGQTNHSQYAVDHYLKDFYRVETLYDLDFEIEFIHRTTGMALHVVRQYIDILDEFKSHKDNLT